MNKTLVIVPTYNEKENLPIMAERLSKLPIPVDWLIVDGNSTDGTAQIADELAAKVGALNASADAAAIPGTTPTALSRAWPGANLTDTLAAELNALEGALQRFAEGGFAPFQARWNACHAYAGREVTQAAIQMHGGIGFTWEADVHWLYKRAQVDSALLGGASRHRARLAEILAERVASAATA